MTETMREGSPPAPRSRVRVLIADADLRDRLRLTQWLGQHRSFEVTQEVTDGAQAVTAAKLTRPDLVILDLAMPRMHGLEAAAEIRKALPDVGIVLRSAFSAGRMARAAVDAGADVYVEKSADPTELLEVLESLAPARHRPDAAGDLSAHAWPAEATDLLEATLVASPVGTVLLDGAARPVITNPVADRLLGGTPLLAADRSPRHFYRPDTKAPVADEELPVRAACQGTPFDDVELFVADRGDPGNGTYVRISGHPVVDPQGTPTGAVISVLDDTATKQAQHALAAIDEELRRSNTELAHFASTASHDLSQPLHQIQGFAELLQGRTLADERAREYVDKIVVACERMRTLVRDLLTVSRITSDARPFERVELGPVVHEVLELFEQQIAARGARVDVSPLPAVHGDPTQLRQLVQNLLGNALNYVAPEVGPHVRVSASRTDGAWLVSVADNGIGIEAQDRERAFGMFQRLVSSDDYAGTGIGLAVCAKIVERHDGRIWIDDAPGGGTTICFTLPDR